MSQLSMQYVVPVDELLYASVHMSGLGARELS
jgi:hypothetical protein